MSATDVDAGSLRRTGAAVVQLGASELLGKVATFVTFLTLARLLGVAEFGVLSLGFAVGMLLAVLSSLGLDSRVVQLGSARPEMLGRCFGALVMMRGVFCVVIGAVTFPLLFATMDRPHAAATSFIVASCLLETFSDAARAVCGARQVQRRAAVTLVCQRFASLALTAGAMLVSSTAWLAALAYLVATAGGVAGMHLAARRTGVRLQVSGSRREARLILQAAPVVGLNAVASMGLFRIDAALVGVMLGTTATGIYSANYRVFETVIFVSWTLSRAFVPVVASRPDDAAHLRVWSQRAMLAMLAIYLPYGVVLALRGHDIVSALFGPAYADPSLLVALAVAPVLFGVGHLCASVLLAIRPDPVVLVASVAALAANVGLNLVLIPRAGVAGAAWSTTLAFLLQSVILLAALQRTTGRLLSVRQLAGVTLGSAAAAVPCVVIAPLLPALLVAGCVHVGVAVVVTRVADSALVAEIRTLRGLSDRVVATGPCTRQSGTGVWHRMKEAARGNAVGDRGRQAENQAPPRR